LPIHIRSKKDRNEIELVQNANITATRNYILHQHSALEFQYHTQLSHRKLPRFHTSFCICHYSEEVHNVNFHKAQAQEGYPQSKLTNHRHGATISHQCFSILTTSPKRFVRLTSTKCKLKLYPLPTSRYQVTQRVNSTNFNLSESHTI
jgi:hypothetical protein